MCVNLKIMNLGVVSFLIVAFSNLAIAGMDACTIVLSDDHFLGYNFDGDLTFQACKGVDAPIKLHTFEIQPPQFKILDNVSFDFDFSLLRTLQAPIKIQLTVLKDFPLFGYVTLPCLGNVGSCTYESICEVLDTFPEDSFAYKASCPKLLKASGFQCSCPFKNGRYYAKNFHTVLGNKNIPSWMAAGDYKVFVLIEEGNEVVGCFKIQFRLL